MKRSKIFLGLTTCALGVAALAASKKDPTLNAFYCTQTNHTGKCVQEILQPNCVLDKTQAPTCLQNFAGIGVRTLYTSINAGSIDCGTRTAPINCTKKFHYTEPE